MRPRRTKVESSYAPGAQEFLRLHREVWQPFFESQGIPGTFSGVDGVPIHYRSFPQPNAKGTILVLTGRGENVSKHAELAHELHGLGFAVHFMDHRGQGLSGRMASDRQVGHVERFEDFVVDAETMWDKVIGPCQNRFMLCHSLGGLVAVHLAVRRPDFFRGLVLCGPMFGIDFHPLSEWLVYGLVSLNCLLGRGREFAPSCGPFEASIPLERNFWTRCRHRYEVNRAQQIRMPETVIGGPSNRWLKEAIEATRRVPRLAPLVKVPVLLFQPECETIVRNRDQNRFCSLAPRCRKVSLEGAWHETLSEIDETRALVSREMKAFLSDLCGKNEGENHGG